MYIVPVANTRIVYYQFHLACELSFKTIDSIDDSVQPCLAIQ